MIEQLLNITAGIFDIVCNIMLSCFAIVLAFMVAILGGYLVWLILDELQKRR